MEYKRLITFGDSWTYGHGLPDCISGEKNPGEYPSELGWVNILARKLDIEKVINLSRPGASNRFILHRVVDFNNFKKDDLIIIQFSHFSRDFYFTKDDNVEFLGSWNLDPSSTVAPEHWKHYVDRTEQEYITRSYEHILATINFLKLQDVTFHCISTEPFNSLNTYVYDSNKKIIPMNIGQSKYTSLFIHNTLRDIKKYFLGEVFWETSEYGLKNKDYALDGSHWGIKTNLFCAERIQYYLEKKWLIE